MNYLHDLVIGRCVCKGKSGDGASRVIYLHADPLVSVDATQYAPGKEVPVDLEIPSLPSERHTLEQIVDKCPSNININFRHLSRMTLGEELTSTEEIRLLHLSAHGTTTREGRYALVMENECGYADFCLLYRLTKLLRHCNVPKCVVLSACYSQMAAKIFIQAGAEHIIACRADQRIMDTSARYFNRFFYMALFNGHTVRRAFAIAKGNVAAVVDAEAGTVMRAPGREGEDIKQRVVLESEKFVLLPEDGDHDVVLFPCPSVRQQPRRRMPRRSISSESALNNHIPPVPAHALGRHVQVSRCVCLLQNHRCVNIVGRRKIGKSVLALMCIQYVNERNFFSDGVYFIDLAKLLRAQNLLEESSASPEESQAALVHSFAKAMGLRTNHPDFGNPTTFQEFFQTISRWHCLLVLDHANCALGASIVSQLVRVTHKAKVLVTSNIPIDLGDGPMRQVVWAKELSLGSCRELIRVLAPWKNEQAVTKLVRESTGSPGVIRASLESEMKTGGLHA